ncbi:MAG: hypothetical protein NPIRA02_35960 [Nitrospirales bacterium]|nr:MAG: hypothetical protein NPIRA02_35960 [Nitrospirales bacterium]
MTRHTHLSMVAASVFVSMFLIMSSLGYAYPRSGGHGKESAHHVEQSHHRDMEYGKKRHSSSCWTKTLTAEQKAKIGKLQLDFKKTKSFVEGSENRQEG